MKLFRMYRETNYTIMTEYEAGKVRRMANAVHVLSTGSKLDDTRGIRDSKLLPDIDESFLASEDVDFLEIVKARKSSWISGEDMTAYQKRLFDTFVEQSVEAESNKSDPESALAAYKTGQRFLYVVLCLHDMGYYYIHSIGSQTYWQALAMQARNCELLGLYEKAKQIWCRFLYRVEEDATMLPYQEFKESGLLDIGPITGCVVSLARIERRLHEREKTVELLTLLAKLNPVIVDEASFLQRHGLSSAKRR